MLEILVPLSLVGHVHVHVHIGASEQALEWLCNRFRIIYGSKMNFCAYSYFDAKC